MHFLIAAFPPPHSLESHANMGKGTDKLYITHSEWSSEDAFGASTGAGVGKQKVDGASFKRLPYNYCSLSLQPFKHPVCTSKGAIFDLTHIVPWLKKHGTNPINGEPLKSSELIKLNFAKNDDGEYVDPVTYKVFTDNTHIVALKSTGNVFSWDTVERLNIKAKNWKDLVTDEDFTRKDIITLQDPQNIESRDLSAFKYLKDGVSTLTPEEEAERADPAANINSGTLGNAAKIIKAKEAVAKSRADREKAAEARLGANGKALISTRNGGAATAMQQKKAVPYNAAQYTSGRAAASFTSTGLTPETSGDRALLTDEEYMLKTRRVKQVGYARILTNHGDLNIELYPEFAPKAVWNFVSLAKKGYYRNLVFHRNIKNFMLQGGDPTGSGRGGQSIWGKNFEDELEGPRKHDKRGVISMANKGKNTNSSQFFILYRQAKHLDLKHTVFAQVVGGLDVLARLEAVEGDDKDRPLEDIELKDVVVFVDPFEEFMKDRKDSEDKEKKQEDIKRAGGTEDERTTWTGKRLRLDGRPEQGAAEGVGKYLQAALSSTRDEPELATGGMIDDVFKEPVKKKAKTGGFGNFDGW
jgi:peptidyl-prolyl cis-trans isomerase-like protein 2